MQGYCEANDINPESLFEKSMIKMQRDREEDIEYAQQQVAKNSNRQ